MAATDDAVANRPRRVRTGCLTCRERHLKCDEGLPDCQNCRKSNRTCKRGVRLNFIDTQVKPIPTIPRSNEWRVSFQDESREIASDYAGGVARYAAFSQGSNSPRSRRTPESISSASTIASVPSSHHTLPPILPLRPLSSIESATVSFGDHMRTKKHRNSDSYAQSTASDASSLTSTTMSSHDRLSRSPPKPPARDFLDSQEKTLFMQVFVEEVGLWMDSLDPAKHFSRLLPFTALEEPMLLHAFLACGARHLTLINQTYTEDKALNYYDTATRLLLNALQDLENRDMEICATTAVILNVYEIMSERATKRMNHIAGARALIQNCHWDARSTGVGGACFWLNVSMELLSCLHFNWTLGWDPDKWELDMSLERDPGLSGNEEKWAQKMVYILAKIANFRATVQPLDYEMQRRRYEEWKSLHNLCIAWNDAVPRSMHPMAYLYPYQTTHKSAFPEVWLIKRCTIVARLFFHTAMVLLAGINPTQPRDSAEMNEMAMQHAHQICGITAHVKDRGVASVALRSLAIAAECLTIRKEQEEVLQTFQKIKQETGWRVDFLHKELKGKWGWENPAPSAPPSTLMRSSLLGTPTSTAPLELSRFQTHHTPQLQTQYQPAQQPQQQTQQSPQQQSQYSQIRRLPQMVNPLIAVADGSNGHPYHPHYVPAPNQHIEQRNQYM